MASTSKSRASRAKRKSRTLAFPVEFRLLVVKLYLEEGYSPKLLVEQFGITPAAWRVEARQWLAKNGLIRIQKAGNVSPNFWQ